jgi:hypothetical protein
MDIPGGSIGRFVEQLHLVLDSIPLRSREVGCPETTTLLGYKVLCTAFYVRELIARHEHGIALHHIAASREVARCQPQ